ncbi:MAG TPA: hypothetical protein VMC84_05615 [Methanocella sp.]|uniref:hypothetical protein n=1 Tax=Methanocella sp. TaxID=2052833 RepID=UPI002B8D8479|nr:hypothetical protein [Methanocella sp.]HTY90637.1 hypothetical protein [Methanocella sp.]
MANAKKGITYKTSYKALKNMISDKIDKEHPFSTKKERKEAVKSVMVETRDAFKNGIADYLDTNIDKCIHKLSLTNKEVTKANLKENKKIKTIGALKSSTKK